MARPQSDEALVLECAEGMAAALASSAAMAADLDVRLRQIKRRVYGDRRSMAVLIPAVDQLRQLAGEIHVARSLGREMLEVLQRGRRGGDARDSRS